MNCTALLNLESLSSILFNRKTLKHFFLQKNLEISYGPLIWQIPEFKIYKNTIKDQKTTK